MKDRFYLSWFSRCSARIIDGETGIPVYDNAPHGKDKPLIFHDEDKAQDVCDRLNGQEETPNPSEGK